MPKMHNSGEYLRVKNFEKYQHYSKRRPPWIKIYFALLSDPDFAGMTSASKMHTIAIMMLASQHDNKIPFNKKWISQVIVAQERINWDEVLSSGFVICYQSASATLASGKQTASTDTEVQKNRSTDTEVQIASSDKISLSAEELFCELPCVGNGRKYLVSKEYIAQMKPLYPGIDIEKETLRAKGWLINNPSKGKTHQGMTRYLNQWYSRSQDKAAPTKPGRAPVDPSIFEFTDEP
jgi:hypothetical protein